MAKIDQRLVDLLKKYGEDNTAVWDCHGTWVAYHAAVERMAAKAGIIFDKPEMIINDAEKKTVVICVSASMAEKREWSFGEVSPSNNKNSYPYAMAEKRAKDRVALKLLGMAGLVYSEEEADDFKASKPSPAPTEEQAAPNDPPPKSSSQLKKEGEWERVSGEIANAMNDVHTFGQFHSLKESYRAEAKKKGWNEPFMFQLRDLFLAYEADVQKRIDADNEQPENQIASQMGGRIVNERITDVSGRELMNHEAA